MPLFDYRCLCCGTTRTDVLVANKDVAVVCPAGHGAMERQLCAPSFVVNGFSSKNLYAGGQTYEVKQPNNPNMRVTVKS